MATLQQTLRGLPQADNQLTRGPGGVLQRGPTLQEATQQAGLAAAPTTPMAAQMTGASQQAAKMAGTPQQMQAALQQATQGPTLETALRQKQYGREATAAETGAMSKSADMQKLGGLGDRVTKMVQNEYQKTVDANVQLSADLDIVAKATDLNTPEVMEAMKRIAEKTGQPLDKIDWASLIPKTRESIAQAAQAQMRQTTEIPISEVIGELGYDIPTLSKLLNVPEADLQKYNVEQLQAKVNQVSTEEFTRAQQLQKQAWSPLTGAAERGLAREAGRELSAVGVRASEADMQKLADEISGANQITFMGQTKSFAEWLSDDEISAMIKEVVDSPPDSQIRKDMQAQSPDFYNFITRNETALKTAAANLDTGVSNFKKLQNTNSQLISDSFGNLPIDPKLQEILIPGSTGLSASPISVQNNTILSHLQNKTPEERKQFAQQISTIFSANPSIAAELSKLSPQDLAALNIEGNGKNWRNYVANLEANKIVANLDSDETGPLLSNYSMSISSPEQVNSDIENNYTMSNLGFGDSSYTTGTLPITDRKVDTTKLKDTFLKNTPIPSLSDAANGKTQKASFLYKEPTMPTPGSPQSRVLTEWGDFGKSGKIPTANDIANRLDQLLLTSRKLYTGSGDNGAISPLDIWVQKGQIINDLKKAGTWAKWGYTDSDADKINPNPVGNIGPMIFTPEDQEKLKKAINLNFNVPRISIR